MTAWVKVILFSGASLLVYWLLGEVTDWDYWVGALAPFWGMTTALFALWWWKP